ncbi:hypothetical protein HMPREF9318_01002 [Streptococcus urinalis FB127-CNA-2]|uniref:Biotin transporter n=2 Tax=Streptococcus urinalis TaxID=149016 RepID=G5KH66_9STRE|nr:BioY family protein [Streptococcus urinalis 2285-97]EKS21048.1 hypothetical protein HMPREF9318_01002 [Streptococcus urinalis FB127-CNA-2]VEF31057.1 BioY family protein [Streptococcus urinalis]
MQSKHLIQVAMMTTILVILGLIPGIPLGFIPVPIVLQNLGVMLAAILLGTKKGSLSILLLFILGLFIPVFSGGRMSVPVFMGPTAGYVLAWLAVPLIVGRLSQWLKPQTTLMIFVVLFIAGVLVVDVIGSIWLGIYTGMPLLKALITNLVFIPGDTVKAMVAAVIAHRYKDSLIKQIG